MNANERKNLFTMKIVATAAVALVLVLFWNLTQSGPPLSDTNKLKEIKPIGKSFQVFEKSISRSIYYIFNKKEPFLSELDGEKVNYISYWAQWCTPCIKEIPELIQLQESSPHLNLIFVNVDNKNQVSLAEKFWQELNVKQKTFYLSGKKESALQFAIGLPYHQIYDKSMIFRAHFGGLYNKFEKEVAQLVESLVKEPKTIVSE